MPTYALVDGFRHTCRAIDLSPTGMVVDRSSALAARDLPQVSPFEIHLGPRPIRARARPVWTRGSLLAVRFVWMNDADRLTIAELLDQKMRLREPLH